MPSTKLHAASPQPIPTLDDLYWRALELLVIHGGACSVPHDSELCAAYKTLARTKLVKIEGENLPQVTFRLFNFEVKFNGGKG